MGTNPEKKPSPRPPKFRQGKVPPTPTSISPTARLDWLTKDRIDALEVDKRDLQSENARLRAEVVRLVSENARLGEALGNAESNNVVATILIGVGGFLVSYATFTGNLAARFADGAVGCLLAGIALMGWQTARRWRRA